MLRASHPTHPVLMPPMLLREQRHLEPRELERIAGPGRTVMRPLATGQLFLKSRLRGGRLERLDRVLGSRDRIWKTCYGMGHRGTFGKNCKS